MSDNETVNKKCCLSFNRDVKYWVDHILNSCENSKRGTLRAKETKLVRTVRTCVPEKVEEKNRMK